MRRALTRWLDHPVFDYPLALIGALSTFVINLPSVEASQRATFYQTVIGVEGALLTLGSISVTIVLTVTPNGRFRRVLNDVGPRLKSLLMSNLTGMAVATIGLLGLYLELGWRADARRAVFLGLGVFSLLRFSRLWWLFGRIASVLTATGPIEQAEGAGWTKPVLESDDYALPPRRRRPSRGRLPTSGGDATGRPS